MRPLRVLLAAIVALSLAAPARAQESVSLTDKIFQGEGTINIIKDIPGTTLMQMVGSDGRLFMGVDLNESLQGNEIPSSIGVAIKSLTLTIVTTQGTFSFSDFWTNTTAVMREEGSAQNQTFYTLFGVTGSAGITPGQSFDATRLDDVIVLDGVTGINGQVLSAQIEVKLVDTATTASMQDNNTFFDYSGGFEDFALLTPQDAIAIEAQGRGTPTDPSVTYTQSSVPPSSYGGTTTPAPPSSSGAPAPPLAVLLGFGALALWKMRADA